MLTVSFKTSTLESIPRYAISEPISQFAGLTARARYRSFARSPAYPPVLYRHSRHLFRSLVGTYITAATSSPFSLLESRSPFFPAPCARNHPLLSCLCFFLRISAAGMERETNEGRVGMRGMGTKENAGERRARYGKRLLENSHVPVNFEQRSAPLSFPHLFPSSFVHDV